MVAQGKVSALAVGTGAAVFGVLCWQAVALKKAQIAKVKDSLYDIVCVVLIVHVINDKHIGIIVRNVG